MKLFRMCSLTLCCALLLTGCLAGMTTSSSLSQEGLQKNLVVGKTTKAEVKKIYGEPTSVKKRKSGDVWVYMYDPAKGNSVAAGVAQSATSAAVAEGTSRATLAGMKAGDTMLTVNGEPIPADLYLYFLAVNCAYLTQMYQADVSDYVDQLKEDSKTVTAYYKILEAKCEELGCPLTDKQQTELQETLMAQGQEKYDQRKTINGLSDETMQRAGRHHRPAL